MQVLQEQKPATIPHTLKIAPAFLGYRPSMDIKKASEFFDSEALLVKPYSWREVKKIVLLWENLQILRCLTLEQKVINRKLVTTLGN